MTCGIFFEIISVGLYFEILDTYTYKRDNFSRGL